MRPEQRPAQFRLGDDLAHHDSGLRQEDVVRDHGHRIGFRRKVFLEIDDESVDETKHEEQDHVVLHEPLQEAVGQDESCRVHCVV